jgi:hypothetical protein
MTRLRVAALFLAVVSGDYAALRLIYLQLVDFSVAAAVCAGSLVTAGLIAHADKRRRRAVARGRAAVWQRRDKQATIGADQQCPSCGGTRQQPSESTRFVERQGGLLCQACAPALNPRASTMSLGHPMAQARKR